MPSLTFPPQTLMIGKESVIIDRNEQRKEDITMPVMDEFKESRERIKNGSLKDKVIYFFDYYKFHVLVTIFVVTLLTILIRDITSQKEDAFYAVIMNSILRDTEYIDAFHDNFAEYCGVDTNEYDVMIDNSINFSDNPVDELTMSASQRLVALTASNTIDVMVGDSTIFPDQANQGMFCDLREILSEEQIAKYEPYFYYVDEAYIEYIDEALDSYEPNLVLPDPIDPTKPEEMEKPVPVGIFVTDSRTLKDAYPFVGEYVAVGVMVKAPHPDVSRDFIDFIFE